MPRWLDTGPNAIRLVRLKDKLGNGANASAEIDYEGATAYRLDVHGQGVRAILEMVHHTRPDTALAPAGLMRAALAEAHQWVAHRSAFERRLIDAPLMRRVIADLVLDLEAAAALGFRVARAFAEDTASLLAAAVLCDTAPGPVADAFLASRLGTRRGLTSGAIGAVDEKALLARLGPPA